MTASRPELLGPASPEHRHCRHTCQEVWNEEHNLYLYDVTPEPPLSTCPTCPTDLARALRGVRVAEAALVTLEVGEVPGAGGGAAAGQARAHGAT